MHRDGTKWFLDTMVFFHLQTLCKSPLLFIIGSYQNLHRVFVPLHRWRWHFVYDLEDRDHKLLFF